MTSTDWLGLIGTLIVGGTILLAALAVIGGIVSDVLHHRAPVVHESGLRDDGDAIDRELALILEPHARRSGWRVHEGGAGWDPAA